MDSSLKALWLHWCLIPSLGALRLAQLASAFDSNGMLSENKLVGLADQLPKALRRAVVSSLNKPATPENPLITAWLEWAERPNNQLFILPDPAYPAMLKLLPDPPPMLFARGLCELLWQPQLAIVGSRNPTATGREHAFQFARSLATNGFTITSGLALGIDGAAHEGSLQQLGSTIAVLGTGINIIYPARHRPIAERIAESGLLVSELPLNAPPKAANFPRRNRIISGLALGTLVVEASIRSGSLITARLALEQGREVFAIPGSIQNPQARGCHLLIKQGAKLAETTDDIFSELPQLMKVYQQRQLSSASSASSASLYKTEWVAEMLTSDTLDSQQSRQEKAQQAGPKAQQEKLTSGSADNDLGNSPSAVPELESVAQQVLDAIGFEATHTDHIVARTGLQVSDVQAQLMQLELTGLVQSERGGYIKTR